MGRMRLIVAVAVAALVAGSPGYANAAGSAASTRVSGPSPYLTCSTPTPDDRVYPNTEVEPNVAANPARPGNLIAVWQQDRWAGGGAHGIVAGYTHDGGRSWQRTTLPFNKCAPGGLNYTRASDPAVSIGPDGTAYAIGLSIDVPGVRTAVASVVSRDGGRTWTTLRVIATDNQGGLDKEWITADPRRAGTAYAVWDNLHVTADGHFTGPAYFSKTTDYGRTWSTPKAIAAVGADRQTIGNQILVDPRTGRLYDTYAYYCACYSVPKVAYVHSDDGGRTWSRQHIVSDLLPVGVAHPGTQAPVRSGGFPLAAITRTGQIYLTWQDSRFSGGSYDEIAVATTRDRGAHWTSPRRANTPTGRAAFTPSVAVNTTGKVAITYYDLRRDNIRDAVFSTDYWATTTSDGVHFTGDRHLAGSFDLLTAPNARGYFVGDYEGLTAAGDRFIAVYAKTNCTGTSCSNNPTDIYSTPFPATLPHSAAAAAGGGNVSTVRSAITQSQPRHAR